MDLRCPSRLHGRHVEDDLIEVKCDSRACGAGRGTVVMHYFSNTTHELVKTERYKNPDTLFAGKEKQTCP
jgi:hypothetical protein